jgi:hypothetical protein
MSPLNSDFIARDYWRDKAEYERMRSSGSFKGSSHQNQVSRMFYEYHNSQKTYQSHF